MAAPTVVYIESAQVSGQATLPSNLPSNSFAIYPAVGDLCVITYGGITNAALGTNKPTYTSGGADAGFTALTTVDGGNSTKGRYYGWWKVLTSSDFSSGILKQFNTPTAAQCGFGGTSRAQIWIYHHASGWDASTAIFSTYSDTAGFTANTNQTLNGAGAPSRANVSILCWSNGTGQSTLTTKWDGGSARQPYCDDNALTARFGGHVTRSDSASWTASSTTVTDTSAVSSDVDRTISNISPADASLLSEKIATVSAGASFTVTPTGANATNSGTVTLSQPQYGTASTAVQADYNEYDAGSGATSFQLNVGVSAGHAVAVYTFQVKQSSVNATGTFAGGGTFSATGTRTTFGTPTFAGGGQFTVTDRTVTHIKPATFAGGGTFSAVPKGQITTTGRFAGGGLGTATWAHLATGSLSGGGIFSSANTVEHVRSGTFGGGFQARATGITGSIPAGKSGTWEAGGLIRPAQTWSDSGLTLAGGGTFSATGRKSAVRTAFGQFLGGGTLRATGTATHVTSALFTVEAVFDATPRTHGKPITLDEDTHITLDGDHALTLDGTHAT